MRRVTAVLSAAAIVIMAAGVFAQAKPSFAGKWTLEPAAAPAAPPAGAPAGGGRGGRGGGGLGMELTITQDATSLTLAYTQGQNPVSLKYMLDGSESKNKVMGRGGETEQVAKAVWVGNAIEVVTTMANGEQKRSFAIDAGNLVVTTTTANGEQKATYKKAM